MAVFLSYAHYYDLLYADKDYSSESDYVFQLIKKYAPTTKSILNLGCGTGKHDVFLEKKGFKITGIDLSEEMISRANLQNSQIDFRVGDVRTIQLNKKFDAVISLFHVACYQNSDHDLISYFNTAANHLNTKGVFIFDVWHGPAVLSDPPVYKTKEAENDELKIFRKTSPVMHKEKNIVDVNFSLEVKYKKTGTISKVDEKHSMRYLFPDEIKNIIKYSNLELLSSEQWMTGATPSDKTWYVTYVARKID
ncbi:MAG: class I SAM-dependent methyltransferase [Bacteroidetes bacterium]|nr:class I SAM-dependent methyltransferase [Bacteroidota bacterium]